MSDICVQAFMSSAGRNPLLTPAEELHLGTLIRAWLDYEGGPEAAPPRVARAGRRARERFVNANLRLVVSVAKKFRGRCRPGDVEFSDLLQEGSLGLVRGVEKFDPTRGYKASTFLYWWVRQGCGRALDRAGTIRLPANVGILPWKVQQATQQLLEQLGRQPTLSEIAEHLGLEEAAMVRQLELVRRANSLASLDARCSGSEESSALGDLVAAATDDPLELLDQQLAAEAIDSAMGYLPEEQAAALELHAAGATMASISEQLGLSRDQLRTQMELGRRRLRLLTSTGAAA